MAYSCDAEFVDSVNLDTLPAIEADYQARPSRHANAMRPAYTAKHGTVDTLAYLAYSLR
jgi:hypothetical protein